MGDTDIVARLRRVLRAHREDGCYSLPAEFIDAALHDGIDTIESLRSGAAISDERILELWDAAVCSYTPRPEEAPITYVYHNELHAFARALLAESRDAWMQKDELQAAIDTAIVVDRKTRSASSAFRWCSSNPTRKWMLTFDDADRNSALYETEHEAREAFERATIQWNCDLWQLAARTTPGAADRNAQDAERYRRLREHITPRMVAECLGVPWTDMEPGMLITSKIDAICDAAIRPRHEGIADMTTYHGGIYVDDGAEGEYIEGAMTGHNKDRDAVIEQCAQVCDERVRYVCEAECNDSDLVASWLKACADTIRALKASTVEPSSDTATPEQLAEQYAASWAEKGDIHWARYNGFMAGRRSIQPELSATRQHIESFAITLRSRDAEVSALAARVKELESDRDLWIQRDNSSQARLQEVWLDKDAAEARVKRLEDALRSMRIQHAAAVLQLRTWGDPLTAAESNQLDEETRALALRINDGADAGEPAARNAQDAERDINAGRCKAVGGKETRYARCGLWEGHDGDHCVLRPSGVPWFAAIDRAMQDTQEPKG